MFIGLVKKENKKNIGYKPTNSVSNQLLDLSNTLDPKRSFKKNHKLEKM